MPKDSATEKLRIDKWCWMTRFYKTRQLAAQAVLGGKVQVNGQRVKSAHAVKIGDVLDITRTQEQWEVAVLGIPKRRGPAKEAQLLYQETEQGQKKRLSQQAVNKAIRIARPKEEVKPDKHQRKKLRQLKHKD